MKLLNTAPTASITYNQSASAGSLASPGTLAYPNNVTAGNLLIATWFTGNASPPSPTISDSQGNTWTPAPGMPIVSASGGQSTWWAIAKSSAANTVTFTSTGAGPWVSVTEYTVIGQPVSLDKGVSASGTTSVTATSGACVGNADLMVIGVGCLGASVPSGWTARQNNGGFGFIADKFATASGVQSATVAVTGAIEIGLLCFYQASNTIAVVQSASLGYGSGASLAFSSGNTAGNSLFCFSTGYLFSSDSQGNVWVPLVNNYSGGGFNAEIYWCPSCKGGANTVTITGTTAFTIAEFSGVTSADIQGVIGSTASSASWTSNAITTHFANELIVGVAFANNGTLTVSSMTNLGSNESYMLAFYKIVSSIQTAFTVSGTCVSGAWESSIVSLYTPTVNPNSVGG